MEKISMNHQRTRLNNDDIRNSNILKYGPVINNT